MPPATGLNPSDRARDGGPPRCCLLAMNWDEMAAGLEMIAAFGDELNLDAFESGCSWGRFESGKAGDGSWTK